jgi:hypothetical protein
MGFFQRVVGSLTGKSKSRLPDQMAVLGAPAELVERMRQMDDLKQEEAFIDFIENRHACMLDWKAKRDDVYAALTPLLSEGELRLIPAAQEVPADAASTIVWFRAALSSSKRTLVHTESLGDFSFLLLVPRESGQAFAAIADGWLIDDEKKVGQGAGHKER